MRNRIQNAGATPRVEFGLMAWLEQTRVVLPLKGVECRFDVCGDLLNVEVDQMFHQDNAQPLDCLYTFPLPAAAAVYRCEMHVNGRMVRARVEEVQRARELVREKKAAGHRTALVEMERDNLFTLSLGNVQPGDVIVVRFAYFQTLTRLADWTSFHIPFCPGVRYIPGQPLLRAPSGRGVVDDTDQVPDASRISPPRIDKLHPDAAYLSVQGNLEQAQDEIRDVSSPSHPVLVRDGKAGFAVSLADGQAVPDADFVLRWTEVPASELRPTGWVLREKDEAYALVRLKAPTRVEISEDLGQDVYFLLDRSGSMQGLKWQQTACAFREFVKKLGPKDRVWLTLFESIHQDFSERPMAPADVLRDTTVQQLESLGTGGGTEMLPALLHVLDKVAVHSADRPATLMLVTDGQVGNEDEVLNHLRQYPNLRLHTVGIDVAVNDGFLTKMAAQQHGTSYLLSPKDDLVGAVARLADRLRRPVLTSIRVRDGWELPRHEVPSLHAGEDRCLCLKATKPGAEIVLRGKRPDGAAQIYRFALAETAVPAVRLLWAKQRIEHHLGRDEKGRAIALAKRHNLICEGAAFVAWDEAEKVAVSSSERELYQPAMMTLGCCESMDHMVCGLMDTGRSYHRLHKARMEVGAPLFRAFVRRSRVEPPPKAQAKRRPPSIADNDPELLRLFPDPAAPGSADQGNWRRGLAEQIRTIAAAAKIELHEPHCSHVQDIQSWCESMFAHTLFRCPEGWALLQVLCEWILSTEDSHDQRMRSVVFLLSRLDDATDDLPEQLSRLHSWAGFCFKAQPKFRPSVRKKLQQLEAAVASAKSAA